MPRLFPRAPHFPDDGGAEHSVWRALRDHLPDDVVVLSGVDLQDGDVEREIDLLVAWPGVGIAAIEVKGGYIRRVDGEWRQGSGEREHRIDPVDQVQDARHRLQGYLRAHGYGAGAARTVHLVAFPHVAVPDTWGTIDLPRAMLIDRADVESGAGVVSRVRHAVTQHGQGRRPLLPDDVEELVEALAGGFPSQVDNLVAASMHESHSDQLTEAQARILEVLGQQQRMRVIGGAGSGKTWLALEQARRRAKAGERVALLCYSRGLGRYLQRVVDTWPRRERPVFVGLFHDLPVEWGAARGADDDPDHWERRLPLALAELAAARPAAELFDSVVVDEAQDFGDLWWPSLLRCLRDPDEGGLFVFMDDAQRVFPRDGRAPIELPPFVLDENLRSTKQIAQTFSSMADARVRPRGLDGPPVRMVDVPQDAAIATADDCVEILVDEGWPPGSIALLATGRRHPAQVNEVELGGYQAYWDDFLTGDDVFYGHVLGFKGLERTVVVLAVNGFHDVERARKILYTGMSRARSLLVVVGPRALVEEVGGEGMRRRLAGA
ncbi:nuclease-related domain-containing DEAD/DEAH box helicase [Cellulomonas sp. PhB143]|uniref:nuclease-related domain-containing DEAD/DEAH box helicase n=1 Tax=Cellulomonas sp. PhB143 TaxID=2485186 RepID=UPI000F4A1640|nr:NERD domain-containing protein [Cellulomonas sp. PhB143]ROS79128.1 PhoH-like protein [Cellulomonas sp. PhB143]